MTAPPAKTTHAWTAAVIVVMTLCLVATYSELRSSPDRVWSTVTGAIGVYAAVFALIELLRLRSVAERVSRSVNSVTRQIRTLIDVKAYQECQSTADRLAHFIESGVESPFFVVNDLIKQYSYCFPVEINDHRSEHRRNRLHLERYCDAGTPAQRRIATQMLRGPVLSITRHLAASTAASIEKHSQRHP
ncbi:hypothetical protein [Stenotrophomonas sp.]|uniref:hypothetical protein n=1 Tax=Stenotrophomonas sp. TaxID=69392 RepID=UPI0028A1DAFA|nr:hypothetical protein [Stenotrophomonas sp.]